MTDLATEGTQTLNQKPIGVFDSGLGGLRVLDRLLQTFPDEHFVYLGDTLHMPYGEKTHVQVAGYLASALTWLFSEHQVKMMVVACNTAASVAPHLFQQYAPTPFIDPVTPICQWLNAENQYETVGVMATPATVASNRYAQLLPNLNGCGRLHQIGCDNLASVIEAGQAESETCTHLLKQYVGHLQAQQVEAIVLGCTHYPYVADQVAALAPEADVLDPSVFMALECKRLLNEHQLANPHPSGRKVGSVEYFVTAQPQQFYQTSSRMPFQAVAIQQPQLINLPSGKAASVMAD